MASIYFKALGIMNGTSVDAVDYSLIRVHRKSLKPEFLGHKQRALPPQIKKRILLAASNQLTTFDLSELHFDLGRLYAKQVTQLSKTWNWDIIGLHGQTVHHAGRRATLQLGTPAFLQTTNTSPVVSDFRSMDVASGGEGAPFAPFFQRQLVKNPKVPMAFHNLGGISNLTWFYKNQVQAFDTGPANILLDLHIQALSKGRSLFDKNGGRAAKGLPEPSEVKRFLKHPYFRKKAPKSCGREEFNSEFLKSYGSKTFWKLSPEDQLATLTELTAVSIAKAYERLPVLPKSIFFYGGGVYNTYLMSRIRYQMPQAEISTTDALGWPSQGLEASVFGFLAVCRWLKRPVHLPQVTGAKKQRPLGQVYF